MVNTAITSASAPIPKRFTIADLYRMDQTGVFAEGERVELIEGEILIMPVPGSPHSGSVNKTNTTMNARLSGRAIVSIQNPIEMGETDRPLPDLALLKLRPDYYTSSHPTAADVLLLIEMADSSLRYDRSRKLALYARAGIPEYWIVDLNGERVEVCRQPHGDEYLQRTVHLRGATLTITAFPDVAFLVDDLLP